MNLLMMTLYYPDECYQEVCANAKTGMQNQINSYQKAFLQGIRACLKPQEHLQVINALPVGIFPLHYQKCFLKQTTYEDGQVFELGGVNLPWLKQKIREIRAAKALLKWAGQSPDNRTVLVYTQYLPYLKAIQKVKRKIKNLRAAVIVTDLPNEYGLSSGRKGMLKKLEQAMGEKQLELCRHMDGFILLTQYMSEVIPCEGKDTMVIEGLIQENEQPSIQNATKANERFEVLYTGTLTAELGIREMMEAFVGFEGTQLRICGGGPMAEEVEAFAQAHSNIIFEGFVSHEKALELQQQADALINPRSSSGLFTRYSFPSKTLEYMRSGKPVLCYHLDGIPDDYTPYLCYIEENGTQGIRNAVEQLMATSLETRTQLGQSAREYVLKNKNPAAQCNRLVQWLRSL